MNPQGSPRSVVRRVWLPHQQYQHCLGTSSEHKFLSLTQDVLNQELWGWGPALCVLTSPLGDGDAPWSLRTTVPETAGSHRGLHGSLSHFSTSHFSEIKKNKCWNFLSGSRDLSQPLLECTAVHFKTLHALHLKLSDPWSCLWEHSLLT